jgi:hypothetical protein
LQWIPSGIIFTPLLAGLVGEQRLPQVPGIDGSCW